MLLSHLHKFLTIDIPKTGTKTLRAILCTKEQHHDGISNNKIVDVVGLYDSKKFKQHCSLSLCIKDLDSLGLDIKSYFTFSFVRNPWERHVSRLFWVDSNIRKVINFTEKLENIILNARNQHHFIYDKDTNTTVDHIARFENYEQEVKKFCDKFGINTTIPHLNKSKKYNYKDFYTKELIDKVYEREHKIIDLMGYTYD